MAKNSMDLLELLHKRGMDGDVDFLREALRVLVEGIIACPVPRHGEVSAQIGTQHEERSPDRLTHRNGYRSRDWDTRVGTMELRIPKVREGSYFPSLLEPRRRSEKALLAVIQQAYVEGVSTRRVDDLVKSLGCDGISKCQVSRICRDLDQVVENFLGRPLDSGGCGAHQIWFAQSALRGPIYGVSGRSVGRSGAGFRGTVCRCRKLVDVALVWCSRDFAPVFR